MFTALTTSRAWIDFAPSYNSPNSPYYPNLSDDQILADMQAL